MVQIMGLVLSCCSTKSEMTQHKYTLQTFNKRQMATLIAINTQVALEFSSLAVLQYKTASNALWITSVKAMRAYQASLSEGVATH